MENKEYYTSEEAWQLWKKLERGLLKVDQIKKINLSKIIKFESFKTYITHSYLPQTFSATLCGGFGDIKEDIPGFLRHLIDLKMKEKKSKKIIGLEIGSFLGLGLKYTVKEFEKMGYDCIINSVDLMYPYKEEISNVDYSIQAFHLLENTQEERIKGQIILHSGKSSNVVPFLNFNGPQSLGLDYAYVDGEHTSGGVYLDLALTLTKSQKGTIILIDDVSWAIYDSKTVVFGIIEFLKDYREYITYAFSAGRKKGENYIIKEYGRQDENGLFFPISSFDELGTKQLILIVKEGIKETLNEITDKAKTKNLYFA